MKIKYLTLSLALIAGLLCIGGFFYKNARGESPDYVILCAGIFIVALGVVAWLRHK